MIKFVIKKKDFSTFAAEFDPKIKKSGIYLKTSREIGEGDEVNIVFQFPEEGVEISGIGEVGWVDEEIDTTGRRGFLVRNIILSPESQETISRTLISRRRQTPTPPPLSPQTPSPHQHYTPPPPPPQQPSTPSYSTGSSYYQEYTPQPQSPSSQQQTPPLQQPSTPSQQVPTANISVNVSSPTTQQAPPGTSTPQYPGVLDEDLKKLKGSKGWIWVLLFLIIVGGALFWYFEMGGKELITTQKNEAPPPPPPQPQKVVVEVKPVVPAPVTKTVKPKPKPKPRPKPKKRRRVITRPAGLIDFTYTTGPTFTHLEFVFNRPYKKFIPSPLENALNIYVPHAYNDTGQEQYFLRSSLVQSVVVTKTENTLTLTIYPSTPSLPYYEFDKEKDRIIINFYKSK